MHSFAVASTALVFLSLPLAITVPALLTAASIFAFLIHVAVSCTLEQSHSTSYFVALAPVTL